MRARVRVDGELLEEIEVNNGLRQGYTMAPILFNLYACVVAERWLDRVQNEEGVGTRTQTNIFSAGPLGMRVR